MIDDRDAPKIDVSYDRRCITVDGVDFAFEFFTGLSAHAMVGKQFKIVENADNLVTVELVANG